ncbi:NELlike 1 (Silurana), partial [Caligus rogercresseyi]
AKFFHILQNEVSPYLLKLGQEMETKGSLPADATRGRISLSQKRKWKFNRSLEPLTIMNESYRILAGYLSTVK